MDAVAELTLAAYALKGMARLYQDFKDLLFGFHCRNAKYLSVTILLPAMLVGQDAKLSDAARELIDKPRFGVVKITLFDGSTQQGRVMRVTDQFIALETNPRPRACEDVELSNIAAMQWVQSYRSPGAPARVAGVIEVAILGPFLGVNAIEDGFKRMSPPLKPLKGAWELRGRDGALKSTLRFQNNTVEDSTIKTKKGRWSIERDRLHMVLDGEPESVTPFHFECEELVLDHPAGKFRDAMDRKHALAPIIGVWSRSNIQLRIMPDGTLVEQKSDVRKGTFESGTTDVKMHWIDSSGLGGSDWIAQIKHHHIVVSIGGVAMTYYYVPPGWEP